MTILTRCRSTYLGERNFELLHVKKKTSQDQEFSVEPKMFVTAGNPRRNRVTTCIRQIIRILQAAGVDCAYSGIRSVF
jgi:hypothetical protein